MIRSQTRADNSQMKNAELLDESCLQIDELDLGKECIRQPHLYFQAATRAADARLTADEYKNTLEVVEAELKRKMREKPEKYGLEKITEGAIDERVKVHSKYKDAQKEHLDARHKQNLADALVAALDQKKRSLTLMVNLHATTYFADVKPSEGGREVAREMTRKSRPVERHRKEIDREDEDKE